MEESKYIMPFRLGSELHADSFKLTQYDNTYLLASSRYYQFYASYIRPRIGMYRGWIEGFHNIEYGIIPTFFLQKIGSGIVSTIFSKPPVLNSVNEDTNLVTDTYYKKSNFNSAIKEAYGYALDGGTSLLKWNKDGNNQLRAEALPMDKFFIETGAYGDVERVRSYIATYHDTIKAEHEYYICEERFFNYKQGKRFPMVHYLVYETSANVTYENTPRTNIRWSEVPWDIQQLIKRDYGDIIIDNGDNEALKKDKRCLYENCKLLPFDDDLGCRLIKFTRTIPAFPKLPFGQPLADLLMNENYAYDQLKYFERLEVYLAKGRILIDKGYLNPNDPDNNKNVLDSLIYEYFDSVAGEGDDKKPQGIQLELRSDNIRVQKQNILNDVAFALNLSSSTVAAWLSDGQTQKTATEIESERTKTTSFIDDKIDIILEPLQELVDIFYHYYGVAAPEFNIVSESQIVKSENIKLYSELYEKGQITSKMLAKEILGTCSTKEIDNLAAEIETQRANKQMQPNIVGGQQL